VDPVIIEFVGTLRAGHRGGPLVMNQPPYGRPISRTVAVIAPGAAVMAMIYVGGRVRSAHQPGGIAFANRRVFPV
jgi:aquaporin Z